MTKKPEIRKEFHARRVCPDIKLSDDEARIVGQELLRLGAKVDEDGMPIGISTKKIVEAARAEASPLHRYIFKESNTQAAQARREDLARKLVQSVRIVVILKKIDHESIPLMTSLRTPTESAPRYVPTEQALETPYMTDQMVKRGISHLHGWLKEFRAFRHHPVLRPVYEGVETLLKEVKD